VIAVLYDGDKNLGWLSADNYLHTKPLTVFDVELLRLYGLTIGHLCTRYRAEDALRQSEEEARQFQMQLVMLNEISLALNRAATFDDLCRMAVEMGRSRMGFERLSLWFYHPETRAMHGSFGTDVTGQTVDERGVSWKVAEVGEPDPLRMRELLNGELPVNVHYEAPLTDADKHTLGRGWLVLAPLHDGGKIIGTVSADNLISHKPLPKYQIELLQLYSSTVGHLCAKKRAEEQLIDLAGERERVRILTDFIRDASHEFRTPLSIVYTKLYLLEKNVDPSAMAAHLRGIQDQADTIFKLVESLVLMSQLDSGVDFHFSSVNIAQILQGVVSQPRLAAEAKKVELKLDVRDHLPPVRADVEKLYRALHNLVENAVRYTSVGRIYVTADLLSDHRVCIRIQDTGVGINELDLPHIFKRFYRADKAHSTRGLGLGLPISRKIIEQHGGTISAESIVNVGTTITVTLPVESAD
jgi:signal transduction histidine kinase